MDFTVSTAKCIFNFNEHVLKARIQTTCGVRANTDDSVYPRSFDLLISTFQIARALPFCCLTNDQDSYTGNKSEIVDVILGKQR